jgi:hypothetical protein
VVQDFALILRQSSAPPRRSPARRKAPSRTA